MNAVRLTLQSKDLPDNLPKLRSAVEARVPVGFNQHASDKVRGSSHARQGRVLDDRLDKIVGKHPGVMKMQRRFAQTWICQLGTLGGGNHFIELCLDEEQRVWVMLHSGSRGVGNAFGRYFIEAARKDMRRHQVNLPDRDLAYFSEGSDLFDDYVEAVDWAQDYALLNRSMMMKLVLDALAPHLPPFKAKRRFNRFDLAKQTEGVECRKDGGVVDEIPAAYKDIDEVMANQSDLIDVVHTLKQVMCIKG